MTRPRKNSYGITWVGEKRNNQITDPAADILLRGLKYHPDNYSRISTEFWGSAEFIIKRITEQVSYINELEERYVKKQISWERKMELLSSAKIVKKRLEIRLEELQPQI